MFENLRPQYAKRFRCIGADCEDVCCRGWNVVVDRATYQKYESLPAMRSQLSEHFSLLTENRTESNYAWINLTPSHACPFFNSDRLCEIQQQYGEQYLSVTCSSYPRIIQRIDSLPEMPPTLSCPEAARLVLLDPELLPGYRQCDGDRGYGPLLALPDASPRANFSQFVWDLRHFTLRLIQDPHYPLWQRLFLLGMFCKKLDELVRTARGDLVPNLLREYARIVIEGHLRDAMDCVPARVDAQLQMVFEVVGRYLNSKRTFQARVDECLREFLSGLPSQPGGWPHSCAAAYVAACTNYYAPLVSRHPHLLENYLLNYVFRSQFPFGTLSDQPPSPLNEYVFLCLEFAVIKGLLIGVAGHHCENFTTAHVIKTVQTVAKAMEHSQPLRTVINWKGLSEPITIAALLKN